VDVKQKRKEKKKEKKRKDIVKVYVCVCICFMYYFFINKIAKIKEEFNILIGSRSRFINLHVSCISNIR
jgi:hypothetical protein